ncbi:MAG: glycosyltransferase family 8 protein [Planctomycetia bacterium]|nr:glycosyltransferase family 8 protein [Planctomycetia bacterium]
MNAERTEAERIEINVALATDQAYLHYAGVLMASVLANASADEQINFFILDGGMTPEGKQEVEALRSIRDFRVQYLRPDLRSSFEGCPDVSYYSMNAYSRLLLPELMPDEHRVIYLDCDMIVDGSLAGLWNTDLEGKSLGVAIDTDHIVRNNSRYYRRLNLSDWSFNSGMLLIDLDKVRREKLFQKTLQWIMEHRAEVKCPDQDALNVLFEHDKKKVSIRYNFIHKWNFASQLSQKCLDKIAEVNPDFADSMRHPVVIHFIGPNKPDSYAFTGDGRLFWKYREMTPWKDRPRGQAKSFWARVVKWYKCSCPVRSIRLWARVRKLVDKKID